MLMFDSYNGNRFAVFANPVNVLTVTNVFCVCVCTCVSLTCVYVCVRVCVSLLLLKVKNRGCHTLLKSFENCDVWIWALQIQFDWWIDRRYVFSPNGFSVCQLAGLHKHYMDYTTLGGRRSQGQGRRQTISVQIKISTSWIFFFLSLTSWERFCWNFHLFPRE